jgi:hypothetical protein
MANNSAEVKRLAKNLYSAAFSAYRYSNFDEAGAHRNSIALVNDLIGADALTVAEAISAKVVAESTRPKITAPPPQPVDIREGMRDLANSLGFNEYETQIFAGTDIKESGNERQTERPTEKTLAARELQTIIDHIVG